MGYDPIKFAVDLTDVTLGRARQLYGIRKQCIENRLKLGR
jgi:hypothetical protein